MWTWGPARAGGRASSALEWDPAHKHALVTLSGSNLIATGGDPSGASSVRSTIGKASGKHYFEVVVGAHGAYSTFPVIGVCNGSFNVTADYPGGASGNAWGLLLDGRKGYLAGGVAYGTSADTGDTIMVAVDVTGGKVWFGKNGAWHASGNPTAGTNEAFSGLSGTLYGAVGLPTSVAVTAASLTLYDAPATFNVW
jgi:hypothetical protein